MKLSWVAVFLGTALVQTALADFPTLYPGPATAHEYLKTQGDRVFAPNIFQTSHSELVEKKRAYLSEGPFARLQENTLAFLRLQLPDTPGCYQVEDPKGLAQAAMNWLEQWKPATAGAFGDEVFREKDPHGLKLFVVSSYLGRCHFKKASSTIETLFRQIQENYIAREPHPVLHYPNLLSYYFNVDLDASRNQIYLFSLRHALVWGYWNDGWNLPPRFELPKEKLEAELKPRGLSWVGFMGESEQLADVLRSDRELLGRLQCGQAACQSRALGENLLGLLKRFHQEPGNEKSKEITFDGQRYRVEDENHGADIQLSPFKDGLQGIGDYHITKLDSDGRPIERLFVAGLVPYLILTRGFFEGLWTEYRVDPVNVVNLFESSSSIRIANREIAKNYLKETLQRADLELLVGRKYYTLR